MDGLVWLSIGDMWRGHHDVNHIKVLENPWDIDNSWLWKGGNAATCIPAKRGPAISGVIHLARPVFEDGASADLDDI